MRCSNDAKLRVLALSLGSGLSVLACGGDTEPSRPPALVGRVDAGASGASDAGEGDAGDTGEGDAGPGLDCHAGLRDIDADGDHYTPDDGDCDDCDKLVNPHAFDLPGNDFDEDCKDGAASEPEACDADLDPDSVDPLDAARALGQCRSVKASTHRWGVVSASYGGITSQSGLGSPLQVWLPEQFGTLTAREGGRLLVMSTGVARDSESDDYTPGCDIFDATHEGGDSFAGGQSPPDGYPKDSTLCKGSSSSTNAPAFNPVSFELTLRAPSNARSLSFDSIFFTYEYPYFVCSPYNDFFTVFATPRPPKLSDDNVLFDSNGDPIGVNTGLLSVCRKSPAPGRRIACELGPELLEDTGFDKGESSCQGEVSSEADIGGAATGWLRTTVPFTRGSLITLRFVLWDSKDPLLDSTVVVDNLVWSVDTPEVVTVPITSG